MEAWFETYRGRVAPEQCDHLGHMNIQYYTAAVWEGAVVLMTRLGLSPEDSERRGIALAAVRMESDYARELRAGDEIVLESAVVRVGEKSVQVRHRLRHAASGEQAMETKVVTVMMDLATRRSIPLPDDVRAAAEALASAGA